MSPCRAHIVHSLTDNYYLQIVKNEYERKGAIVGLHQPIGFKQDKIILDIPKEGILTLKGWKVTQLAAPMVNSCGCQVDFVIDSVPPTSHTSGDQGICG